MSTTHLTTDDINEATEAITAFLADTDGNGITVTRKGAQITVSTTDHDLIATWLTVADILTSFGELGGDEANDDVVIYTINVGAVAALIGEV